MRSQNMSLVEIKPDNHDVTLNIAYATTANFTGVPVYRRSACYLHKDADNCLKKASRHAKTLGCKF